MSSIGIVGRVHRLTAKQLEDYAELQRLCQMQDWEENQEENEKAK